MKAIRSCRPHVVYVPSALGLFDPWNWDSIIRFVVGYCDVELCCSGAVNISKPLLVFRE